MAIGKNYRLLNFGFCLEFSTTKQIVEEFCHIIWKILNPIHMSKPTKNYWKKISKKYKELWNFSNYLGSLDGKHINIRRSIKEGSVYYNYKGSNSIVLLTVVDAYYMFITIIVRFYGRNSDGNVFTKSVLGDALENKRLDVPKDTSLKENEEPMPCVIVTDKAFTLKLRDRIVEYL